MLSIESNKQSVIVWIASSELTLTCNSFYNLGLAYSFDRHYGKSIEYYNKAISVINCRIQRLKDIKDGENNDELRELEGLLPDLLAKVTWIHFLMKTLINLAFLYFM